MLLDLILEPGVITTKAFYFSQKVVFMSLSMRFIPAVESASKASGAGMWSCTIALQSGIQISNQNLMDRQSITGEAPLDEAQEPLYLLPCMSTYGASQMGDSARRSTPLRLLLRTAAATTLSRVTTSATGASTGSRS